jgi:hypothetical protein
MLAPDASSASKERKLHLVDIFLELEVKETTFYVQLGMMTWVLAMGGSGGGEGYRIMPPNCPLTPSQNHLPCAAYIHALLVGKLSYREVK